MTANLPKAHWSDPLASWFLRFAAGGAIPARWFLGSLPPEAHRAAKTGKLHIEIVSHCWNYSHFLAYQLSSLLNFPPEKIQVTMTVFYNREDLATRTLLDYFTARKAEGISWNWQELSKPQLFRRGIGRNIAAKNSSADWLWFTDCDLLFRENCLDRLAELLQGRRDALLFPRVERVTSLLREDDPMLKKGAKPGLVDIDTREFNLVELNRATGPMQITHGDVARACGYCESLPLYQTPSDVWCKAHEDRAFRWLLRSQGSPLDVPEVYRIRHITKGRYTGSEASNRLRSRIRRLKARWERARPGKSLIRSST